MGALEQLNSELMKGQELFLTYGNAHKEAAAAGIPEKEFEVSSYYEKEVAYTNLCIIVGKKLKIARHNLQKREEKERKEKEEKKKKKKKKKRLKKKKKKKKKKK